ncbi:RICIN domain-containing protein [Nonomuraea soli]|uniref:Ricin B lectin domain-containing protein n=1 Tax=Nonomuraea soli TaxID=1032476 RepID=A0A7W0HRK9_9ACTN|nr:RICIN domain-containing protein [Nonomuraea soli]MBA2893109.1 hypothetical protein [Nonomuraea soli]
MNRTRSALLAAGLLAGVIAASGAAATSASAAQSTQNAQSTQSAQSTQNFQWFQIVAEHSGMCLDVAGASTAHAADVIQGTCGGPGAGRNQHWRLEGVPGFARHVRVIARHSGKCLDVAHVSAAHGANVLQAFCGGPGAAANQLWEMRSLRSGTLQPFRFVALHSGKCLDVKHASLAHAADVIQGTCGGLGSGANQVWRLRLVAVAKS